MSESFTLGGGFIIAEVMLHPNSIGGAGRAELPILTVPLQFLFRAHQQLGCGLNFVELRCRVSPFDQCHIAHSLPANLRIQMRPGAESGSQMVYLEIPFDHTRLAAINRSRNGGDVRLRFDLEMIVEEIVELTGAPKALQRHVWGLGQRHQTTAILHASIPRSDWLERVLPGTGFGKTHLIELPVIPIESCSMIKPAFEALMQAQKLESQGFYTEAVSKCRIALESFLEIVDNPDPKAEPKRVPKLKTAWQTRLGLRTYEWLDSALSAVKKPMNDAAHFSGVSFDQLEAQMLLTVATALIAYAVKTQPQELLKRS